MIVLALAAATLAGCDSYQTNDVETLKSTVLRNFPLGTSAAPMIAALENEGFVQRGPVFNTPGALQTCLTRRHVGKFQLSGGTLMHLCYDVDDDGLLTVIDAASTRSTI